MIIYGIFSAVINYMPQEICAQQWNEFYGIKHFNLNVIYDGIRSKWMLDSNPLFDFKQFRKLLNECHINIHARIEMKGLEMVWFCEIWKRLPERNWRWLYSVCVGAVVHSALLLIGISISIMIKRLSANFGRIFRRFLKHPKNDFHDLNPHRHTNTDAQPNKALFIIYYKLFHSRRIRISWFSLIRP